MNRKARHDKTKRKKIFIRTIIIILLILLLAAIVYEVINYTMEKVVREKRNIEVACLQTIKNEIDCKALILYDEEFTTASCSGHFENIMKSSDRVRKGALLGYYVGKNGNKKEIRAKNAGVFFNWTDGMEKILQNFTLQDAGPEIFNYIPKAREPLRNYNTGEAVFKIINSLKQCKLVLLLTDLNSEFQKGQKVKVLFRDSDLVKAEVLDYKRESKSAMLLLELENIDEVLLKERKINVKLLVNTSSGFIIPIEALVDKEEQKGVYCIKDGNFFFKPVEELRKEGENVIVTGLDNNDMYLKNPESEK